MTDPGHEGGSDELGIVVSAKCPAHNLPGTDIDDCSQVVKPVVKP